MQDCSNPPGELQACLAAETDSCSSTACCKQIALSYPATTRTAQQSHTCSTCQADSRFCQRFSRGVRRDRHKGAPSRIRRSCEQSVSLLKRAGTRGRSGERASAQASERAAAQRVQGEMSRRRGAATIVALLATWTNPHAHSGFSLLEVRHPPPLVALPARLPGKLRVPSHRAYS